MVQFGSSAWFNDAIVANVLARFAFDQHFDYYQLGDLNSGNLCNLPNACLVLWLFTVSSSDIHNEVKNIEMYFFFNSFW